MEMRMPQGWKWFANFCYVSSTLSLFSPYVAAHSVYPWAALVIGNSIWAIDTYWNKDRAWMWLAIFFVCWDTVLILSRLFPVGDTSYLLPIIKILGYLP